MNARGLKCDDGARWLAARSRRSPLRLPPLIGRLHNGAPHRWGDAAEANGQGAVGTILGLCGPCPCKSISRASSKAGLTDLKEEADSIKTANKEKL